MWLRLRLLPCLLLLGCGAPSAPAPVAAAPTAPAPDPAPVVIPGTFAPHAGPDGNSVVLDAPRGLIVVDTGRHLAHQEALLAHARAVGKPIAVIVNTHWHLDHTGGNAELLAAFPDAEVVATPAIDGALAGFFPDSRARGAAFLASDRGTPAQRDEVARDLAAIDDPAALRPTRPITRSGPVDLAGRTVELRVAPFAATEADLWIVDEPSHTVIAGDLVVASVPFLDTACAAGWRAALADVDAVPFTRLVPGHGAPMTHAEFATWRAAFDGLLDCAASAAPTADCVAGWDRAAAAFIPVDDAERTDQMLTYYVDERLRAADEQARYCAPLGG
ncbi:MAG: MBL fold metallo-hydrolase [Kofleriaceae bacterium]|nr:MBL fold metallo-hydrolase [Myxococcales bacterium]MCB9564946.1 MBL fold metallo-hydrolase [Kofleriaceae bacterium]